MLRDHYPDSVYVSHILESSVLASVESSKPFGILTTGQYWKEPLTHATKRIIPGYAHELFAGVWCSGVGVLQLGSDEQEHDRQIAKCAVDMAKKGVRIVILGCAGMLSYSSSHMRYQFRSPLAMSRMEEVIQKGISDAGLPAVHVVDGSVEALKFALRKLS